MTQTFTPIVLTAPGATPVQLDPLKVVSDRLFVCSNSGGGKSHATRLLIEQASRGAVIQLMDSGRKRGLGVVLVTQRFAKELR